MDNVSTELADVVELQNLTSIAASNHDVDHAQVVEELNSFTSNNPDIDSVASEQLQHGLVLPAIFVGIALVQFTLACVVFASLIYFVIRDYAVLQRDRRRLHVVRLVPGEEQGGDNHANDDDDNDADDDAVEGAAGVPPAAPEGTPPSQFPSDIVRRRPAAPPPPPSLAAAGATARRPVAVVHV